ncbi:MAG: hypothetical protein ACXADH_18055 [Candidatus Kariarchaeaceae archaeon]|jgi:hypothetical protein
MSAEMRSFMEAYQAVHNKEAKENLDKVRDSISEMNLSQLTDGDLCEIAEEVLEVMFAEGKEVAQCEAIVESILTSSTNPGRQTKIERLQESFKKVFGTVKEKSARTAVESYALYRKGKSLQDNWSRKFSHENGNVRLHNSLVAEDRAGVKNGLLKMIEGKDGDPCWDTHKQVGMKKKGGKMVPNCVPKEETVVEKKGDGNLANNYPPYDKVTRGDIIAGATGKDQMGGKNIRGNDSKAQKARLKAQKARLEKKRGMKLDDHPQFKEELEATGKFTAQEIEAIIEKL